MNGIEERLQQITEKLDIIDSKISLFQVPANEQILDDVDLQKETKVSRRTTAMWRSEGLIKHSKIEGKVVYSKSWLIEAVEATAIKPIWKRVRLKNEIVAKTAIEIPC